MALKQQNKKVIAGLASVALAGTLVATSLAVGHNSAQRRERIAPRAHALVVRSPAKGKLVDRGSHFAWRVNGEDGVSFR
jgi:hypothetical protein